MEDHSEPLDGAARFCRRTGRDDLSVRGHRAAVAGYQEPGTRRDLRIAAARCCQHADRQSRCAAVDNADLRRAMALTLDRKSFIDVLSEGQADVGGAMLPPPEGLWGLPPDRLKQLPGYDPDVQKSRAAAREIMQQLGYGPNNPLAIKVATRNIPLYRDPAVMLIDQLKEIYISGELEIVETANWNPKVTRRDYKVGMENPGNAVVDDPDQQLYESYACDSDRNFTDRKSTRLNSSHLGISYAVFCLKKK